MYHKILGINTDLIELIRIDTIYRCWLYYNLISDTSTVKLDLQNSGIFPNEYLTSY